MRKFLIALFVLALSVVASAQTNVQVQYDFGRQELITTALEGNYNDSWGSTFFFVDFDMPWNENLVAGTYGEFSRTFNFWQESKIKDLGVQVEFDAGVYNGFNVYPGLLAGLNYTFHNENFTNFLQVQVLYKTYFDNYKSDVPMQFTIVWGCFDLFGAKGLAFQGFADFWWQQQYGAMGYTKQVFLSEPQLWYNIGQWFGVDNLNIGGEVELAVNFDVTSERNFTCYPCLGIKWVLF